MLPDSAAIKGAVRKAVAAMIGVVLAVVLLTALLITGFYLLVGAATLALAPLVGEPGAMAITGLACLCLLALFFYRMTRPAKARQDAQKSESGKGSESPIAVLRSLIARNPLEAAALAFAAGVAEQSDPRLKELLLQGGMAMMRPSTDSTGSESDDLKAASATSGHKTPAD
ncbi:MAG: hypothetical protein V7713_18685 [Marinobacter sp.]|uniref:hypothetical protein n=1 Tax=Marinobacter sp. AC-23 TaxID=1879031 RepID=UPI0008DCAA92|nr:hypothetical protein [Marinobacter sp. AC-23]OHY71598.1 hypothetical protein BCA33_06865 [Marinobacter sp. AC-23]